MAEIPFLDTHVHLWDPQHCRLAWLDGSVVLNKKYSVAEFTEHSAGVPLDSYIYLETGVSPHFTLVEMRWAAERAAEDARMKGIVAAAPLEVGARLKAYLQELQRISPLIKGIRRITQGEKDAAAVVLKDDFVKGAQILADFNYSCDLCFSHAQIPVHIELIQRCPKTQFMIDHIAKPNIKARELEPWRENMRKLAALPNVFCKISGAVTEADREKWVAADLAPYILHVIDCFGPERICFGGDWPVSLQASTYKRWWETVRDLTASLPEESRRKFWIENGRKFYRVG
jgi:L-fuconolactonase